MQLGRFSSECFPFCECCDLRSTKSTLVMNSLSHLLDTQSRMSNIRQLHCIDSKVLGASRSVEEHHGLHRTVITATVNENQRNLAPDQIETPEPIDKNPRPTAL